MKRKDGCKSGGKTMKPKDYKGDVALGEDLQKLKTKQGYWRKPIKEGTSRDTSVSTAQKNRKWPELKGIDDQSPEYRKILRSISPSYWVIGCLSSTRTRARIRNLEHNIDKPYILNLMGYKRGDYWNPEKEVCPVLGIPYNFMSQGKGGRYNSKSVDRIDPTKGYIKGNIRFISRLANSMFVNSTPEQQLQCAVWRIKNDTSEITDKKLIKKLIKDATNFIY